MSLNHPTVAGARDNLAESNHTVIKSGLEMTSKGSVGHSSLALEMSEHKVKRLEKDFTEHDANNQRIVKKPKTEQAGPVDEDDEYLHSHLAAMGTDKDASTAEDITVPGAEDITVPGAEDITVPGADDITAPGVEGIAVPAASGQSTCSSAGLEAIKLFHGDDFSAGLPEVTIDQSQSTSSEQPVGEEETCDSSYPASPESSGLSLSRIRISGSALTLVYPEVGGQEMLDTLLTSNGCEVDESHSHFEGLSAVGGFPEEIGVTWHSLLNQPPSEPPSTVSQPPFHQPTPPVHQPLPGTKIDIVSVESVFPSGEPGVHWDIEPLTLGEGELGYTCSICFDHLMDCVLHPCGHYSCSPCMDEWKKRRRPANLTCPFCRQVVIEVCLFVV